ncbi:LysE/ArgO family amino acid transporter [Psychrobacter celer]|uniref:LysE/ArgO family amino acid transporter n=1 Tax=Psychrobacter TaxID=497 RepID=UPI000946E881|nr:MULTISPECIES: LysE family transporter [unclassified Psychrobacter]MDN5733220.1 LysE family transporter [Psychrobacter sp.]OLF40898.1 amino acid transporter [Psychrobacter sp. Rd 27.2]PJX24749.1 amino acid transporter [Psychrobacter sp. L7]
MYAPDFLSGFLLGLSLIIAIGSQNAFVLKQGLKREHIFFVCLFCALSDAILISAGVGGFGAVTARYPHIVDVAKFAGVVFLLGYGLQSLYASVRLSHALTVEGQVVSSLKKALLLCFGFTWLNPHVYLDTLVLVGMVSTGANSKVVFAAGAVSASFFFFFALGYGARLLKPLFAKPKAWNILDALVGILMLYLAWHLYQS